MMTSSGILLLVEWRESPISDSKRGERIGPMPLYFVFFTVTFFIGVYSFLGWYFS